MIAKHIGSSSNLHFTSRRILNAVASSSSSTATTSSSPSTATSSIRWNHMSTSTSTSASSSSSSSSSSSPSTSSSSSSASQTPSATATSSAQLASGGGEPTHHFITLRRSAIGLTSKSRDTIAALGLKRRHSSVLHPFGVQVAGQILRVKELIEVQNVTKEEGERLLNIRRDRSEGSGVEAVGLAFGGGRSSRLGL